MSARFAADAGILAAAEAAVARRPGLRRLPPSHELRQEALSAAAEAACIATTQGLAGIRFERRLDDAITVALTCLDASHAVRSRRAARTRRALARAEEDLAAPGRAPRLEELATHAGVSTAVARRATALAVPLVADVAIEPADDDDDERLARAGLVDELMSVLAPDQRRIVELRMQWGEGEPDEIAAELGAACGLSARAFAAQLELAMRSMCASAGVDRDERVSAYAAGSDSDAATARAMWTSRRSVARRRQEQSQGQAA